MYFNAILANITGTNSLCWSVMFPISSEPSLLDILMNLEFTECRSLTTPQVEPVYGRLQYSQETSELYEFRWQVKAPS